MILYKLIKYIIIFNFYKLKRKAHVSKDCFISVCTRKVTLGGSPAKAETPVRSHLRSRTRDTCAYGFCALLYNHNRSYSMIKKNLFQCKSCTCIITGESNDVIQTMKDRRTLRVHEHLMIKMTSEVWNNFVSLRKNVRARARTLATIIGMRSMLGSVQLF